MGKKEEIAAQIAALQKDLETADDSDYEVHIRHGDKSARVPASQARGWLKDNFGIGADEPATGEGGTPPADPPADPPAAGGIWGRK